MMRPSRPPTSTALGWPQMLQRVRAEYLEMPGLSLTTDQAARLWAVDRSLACLLLERLVTSGFLSVRNRKYARPA